LAKKEEAIEEILLILKKNYGTEKDFIIAKEILDSLENKIGMIPPSRYLDILSRYDNGWEE
jgi:hypothetical protein